MNVINIQSVASHKDDDSPTMLATIRNSHVAFLVDTGASVNLISDLTWQRLGQPSLQKTMNACAANGTEIKTLGMCTL